MTTADAIVRTVDVSVDPVRAFDLFTAEIGEWFRGGPYSWNDPAQAVGIRFEPGVGGRWLEVWDRATGEGYEMGRIVAWEPGRRLLVTYRSMFLPPEPLTEIEVRFEPIRSGTRVVLEHRGWERLAPEIRSHWSRRAWRRFMAWFEEYAGADRGGPTGEGRSAMSDGQRDASSPGQATPMLSYEDVAAALPWLEQAFGFGEVSDQRYTDDEGRVTHAELRTGGGVIMLGWPGPDYESPRHHRRTCQAADRWLSPPHVVDGVHISVADADAHAERARRAGAMILLEPTTEPYGRLYVAEDLEGHRWMFTQPIEGAG